MATNEDDTRFDRWKRVALNHRWIAVFVFVGMIVIAIGSFTDALLKIKSFIKPIEPVGIVSIDAVTRVINPERGAIAFDVVVRNTTKSAIAITEARFDFDEHLSGIAMSVMKVSGVYLVDINEDGSVIDGPIGKQKVSAWYPNPDGKKLIVKSPISQTLDANSIDRFRLVFSGTSFLNPFEQVSVMLKYNGNKHIRKNAVSLTQ